MRLPLTCTNKVLCIETQVRCRTANIPTCFLRFFSKNREIKASNLFKNTSNLKYYSYG